jgi:superfamily II DNA or RNA helicase
MKFRHVWRPYQERVLGSIRDHLDDKRLHIVAAPGAGKTTLGLEVVRVLGKSALILSPTRIIRDQWLDRLRDFIDSDDVRFDWASNSLRTPKVLTSITYQALHAEFSEELNVESDDEDLLEEDVGLESAEINGFIKVIERCRIQVLVLDEAHHLRSEWWRALEKVLDHFPDMILVSLTATPPYDSQDHEWSRYEQLCGPIDEEISVPELVKAGTLCAHQDFLWACDASQNEKRQIKEYDDRVYALCNTLFDSEDFKEIVLSHPWLHSQDKDSEIIKEPEIALALLVFIKAKTLPKSESLLGLLDMSIDDVPDLGRHWWQVLVETILFSKTTEYNEQQAKFVDSLKRQLKASELLYKRELILERSRRIERSLSLSLSKIDACGTIHRLEYKYRGEKLRQVILTDYIRDEALVSGLDAGDINLGAWPVFYKLITGSRIPNEIGLITGRLSIIPAEKYQTLLKHIESDKVKSEPVDVDGEYLKITAPLNHLTSAFTQLLTDGELKALVGTRSLLGEGWDAPAINSLILASSVGSFMLTNQMRGRAIRINPKDSEKISSIWHLVAVNAESFTGWSDYHNLKRRFNTFVGLSEKELTIESGFARMNATSIESSYLLNNKTPVSGNNRQMLRRYKKLDSIADRWRQALSIDQSARVIPSVRTGKTPRLRGLLLKNSFSYLLTQIVLLFGGVVSSVFYYQPRSSTQLLLFLAVAFFGVIIYKLPKTLSIIKTLFLYLPVDGALKQIGKALTEALSRAGFIDTSVKKVKVNVAKTQDGAFYLALSGCTFYESSVFADCLAEILGPIDNPRYLVVREGRFLGQLREDFHAVPMRFGVKKETAMIFFKSWNKNVSLSELIYTRSAEGRKRLLKAKMRAFSSVFKDEVKRQDKWQ